MLRCPDCNAELGTVVVEQFATKTADVNYEAKTITTRNEDWEPNDHAFHCPNCDSLNVDDMFQSFEYQE